MTAMRTWFGMLPGNTRGFIWAMLATLAFMSLVLLVRHLSGRFNAGELAFWRALLGLLLLSPMFLRSGPALFRTRQIGTHIWRNLLHFVGVAGWFFAIGRINLSVGMSLQFTVPLFTILLAILFLHERVTPTRWVATALGFAGVLIILRPGYEPIPLAAVACIVSAVGYAGANIATKILMRTSTGTSDTIVFYMNLMHLPLALATAWAMGGITVPTLADMPWLLALGASATLAHWLLARALGEADASLIIVIDFTKLPWVTLGAFIFFGEAPVIWAWAGAAVIFCSTYFIVRREARAARNKTT